MEILLEKTDDEHLLSASEIADIIEARYGVKPNRKTISDDIKTLQEFGLDIITQKGGNPGNYVASRFFELAELKLLVDAVQSSKFITEKKSAALINKLKKLTNEEKGKQLQRQVHINNRIKADNETIFYNVDNIHNAIAQNKQITFKYAEWNINGKLQFKKNGDLYVASPWALMWDDDYYYLIAYVEDIDEMRHYRVDKMKQMDILDTKRLGKKIFDDYDLAAFSKKTFRMFAGKDEKVTLVCKNEKVGIVLDRFGKEISLVKEDEDHVRFSTTVSVSNQFFGWLTGVGMDIQIKSPKSVQEEYKKYLSEVLKLY